MADRLTQQDLESVRAREEKWQLEANTVERLRTLALATIQGGVWHTTSPDRFSEILGSGAILA